MGYIDNNTFTKSVVLDGGKEIVSDYHAGNFSQRYIVMCFR